MKPRSHLRVLLALVPVALWGGCSAPVPRPASLGRVGPPGQQPIALLPVQAGDVRVTLAGQPAYNEINLGLFTKSQQSAMQTAIAALDALAARHGATLGPSATAKTLGPDEGARLAVYLGDPGPLTEAWKVQGLAVIARRLSGAALVRTRITVRYTRVVAVPAGVSQDPAAGGVEATISAELDRIDAASGRIIGHGRGEGSYQNSLDTGVVTSAVVTAAVPYVPGTSFSRAVEAAIQGAWRALHAPPALPGTPPP